MEVINYREQPKEGSVVALFDVVLPKMGMTIANFKVIRSKKGGLFPVPPSYSEVTPDGKRDYFPYIRFNEEKGALFNTMLLELLQPFIKVSTGIK